MLRLLNGQSGIEMMLGFFFVAFVTNLIFFKVFQDINRRFKKKKKKLFRNFQEKSCGFFFKNISNKFFMNKIEKFLKEIAEKII